jgi:hypothetical protein
MCAYHPESRRAGGRAARRFLDPVGGSRWSCQSLDEAGIAESLTRPAFADVLLAHLDERRYALDYLSYLDFIKFALPPGRYLAEDDSRAVELGHSLPRRANEAGAAILGVTDPLQEAEIDQLAYQLTHPLMRDPGPLGQDGQARAFEVQVVEHLDVSWSQTQVALAD